ncbi:MAG: tyrosine-type recombinase/integrase [Alphaproteobacteria bacterium]
MKRDKPKYVQEKKLANGVISYYFVMPARLVPEGLEIRKSIPLGSGKWEAYAKAEKLNKEIKEFRNKKDLIINKSLSYLWTIYIDSRFYKDLAARTKKDYENAYKILSKKKNKKGVMLSDTPLDLFNYDIAYKLYENLVEEIKERWAKNCMDFLRLIYNFGLRKERLSKKNPFENMRIRRKKPEKLYIPIEDVHAIINKAKEMAEDEKYKNKAEAYRAIALGTELDLYFAQRPADVLKLRKDDLYKKDGHYFFSIIQNKMERLGKKVILPVPKHLEREILSKKDFIICDDFGDFTVRRFQDYFRNVCQELGFNYTFRLMRHSGSTAYIEAGVTSAAAIVITGHESEKMFNSTYKSPTEKIGLTATNKLVEYVKSQNEKNKKSE